jgi:hypothetical protein
MATAATLLEEDDCLRQYDSVSTRARVTGGAALRFIS